MPTVHHHEPDDQCPAEEQAKRAPFVNAHLETSAEYLPMNARTQPSLFPDAAPRERETAPRKHRRQARAFDIDNREAARIIASDPVRYPYYLMQEWSKMVMEKNR
jgi:hypothetical protein